LTLDRAGSWPESGIGWLAPSAAPAAVLELADCLRGVLRAQEIAFDAKRFKPHVTVVRKLKNPVATAAVQPIEWPVREFVLLRSRLAASGPSYEHIGRWALADG
jgi:2'-5' RNA ligase